MGRCGDDYLAERGRAGAGRCSRQGAQGKRNDSATGDGRGWAGDSGLAWRCRLWDVKVSCATMRPGRDHPHASASWSTRDRSHGGGSCLLHVQCCGIGADRSSDDGVAYSAHIEVASAGGTLGLEGRGQ